MGSAFSSGNKAGRSQTSQPRRPPPATTRGTEGRQLRGENRHVHYEDERSRTRTLPAPQAINPWMEAGYAHPFSIPERDAPVSQATTNPRIQPPPYHEIHPERSLPQPSTFRNPTTTAVPYQNHVPSVAPTSRSPPLVYQPLQGTSLSARLPGSQEGSVAHASPDVRPDTPHVSPIPEAIQPYENDVESEPQSPVGHQTPEDIQQGAGTPDVSQQELNSTPPLAASNTVWVKPQPQNEPKKTAVKAEDYEVMSLLGNNKSPRSKWFKDKQVINKTLEEHLGANLQFYRNKVRFRPHGDYIDDIHMYWLGHYDLLAELDTYIQWLFPISDKSRVNPFSEPLKQREAEQIYETSETRRRVVRSYRLMLDFYGLALANETSGQLTRASHWRDRFFHLKRSSREHSRLTRIIKSLGELGFTFYQAPLVLHLLHETLETKELAGISPSCIHHWIRAILYRFEREFVIRQFRERIREYELDSKNIYKDKHSDNTRYYTLVRKKL
ncbi:opioid growth factor receptor-like protein 1 isoform X2 [Dreissena polymorpha]|uniref:opioid growth factor receptor-like protein 1 isoform X2 n=1 Tax=Dreissena polymorpha TaxID=45954 RepID=UPI002264A8EF|nr:opioid growth factor receptor-like protein 1 isoform X2 [Dreissena polymorpha]